MINPRLPSTIPRLPQQIHVYSNNSTITATNPRLPSINPRLHNKSTFTFRKNLLKAEKTSECYRFGGFSYIGKVPKMPILLGFSIKIRCFNFVSKLKHPFGAPSGTRIVKFSFGSFAQSLVIRAIMRFLAFGIFVIYCNFSYLFITIKDK